MLEKGMLARYASHPGGSRGRFHAEPPAPTRTEYQRDRDRIVHSTAFRRLVYKTQVFLNHEGDLFRTRMTHSLEVAQLGRSVGRSLGLNEDLIEAIALAHDLGHTPFGHAGQDALHACMAPWGGFEHNLQSLRVVDHLEERYPQWNGLNLTFETREGILKHCSRTNALAIEAVEPEGVGRRFLDGSSPSLEAQLCNLADEIAYNAHDIDDGVRSGLIDLEQVAQASLLGNYLNATLVEHPGLASQSTDRRLLYESIRRMLSAMVYDLIETTRGALERAAPPDVAAVRAQRGLVAFSGPMQQASQRLKTFLMHNLYRHSQVMETTARARRIIQELFEIYRTNPAQMPAGFMTRIDQADGDPRQTARTVADYIAGMTDRYAMREHHRHTGLRIFAGDAAHGRIE